MALVAQFWHRVPMCKRVNVRRINASAKVERRNKVGHLLSVPTLIKFNPDGSIAERLVPDVSRKSKRKGKVSA